MIVSLAAIELTKRHEGFSPVVYNCPGGHATIGYGHKIHDGPFTKQDERLQWSQEHAEIVLRCDMTIAEQAVNLKVRVPLNQNQFDSLVCWTYNMGIGRLREADCTWLRELNKGNYSVVPEQLKRWTKVGGKELPGLVTRRNDEANLFLKPYPEEA
jgi:lysozyme